jgi:hypothetical protein
MRYALPVLVAAVLAAAGCGGSYEDPLAGVERPQEKPGSPADAKAAEPVVEEPASEEPEAPAEKPVREKADVGAGEKGSGYGGGIITTPVSVYWRAQERITYQIQIPQAMQLFKANNGRAPESHEEFMEKIIGEQNIDLPELPVGHKYVYDPKEEELMVEHPK